MEEEIINIGNPIPAKNKGWHLLFDKFIKSIKSYIENTGGGGSGRTYQGISPISVNNTTNKISVDLSVYSTKEQADLLYNPINSTTANDSQSASSVKLPTWNNKGQITGSAQIYGQEISVNGSTINSLNDSSTSTITIYAPITAGDSGKILASNGSGAPTWIDNGIPKEIVADSVLSKALDSNKYYVFEDRTNDLTITLANPSNSNIANEYHFVIIIPSGETVPTVTFPSGLYWQNGAPSGLEVEKAYEFSILDDIAIYAEIDYETVQ